MPDTQERLIEPYTVLDTFASGLRMVEDLGGNCYRFTFTAKHFIGGREESVIVARLVMPLEAVPPALIRAAKAVGLSMPVGAYFPRIGLH